MATLESAADYRHQAWDFLEKSRKYLAQGDLHQASEKGWGAAAHMVKAVADVQGWTYDTHSDFSVVMNQAVHLTGNDRLRELRALANDLHHNYYQRKMLLDASVLARDIESVAELLEILAPLTE